MSSRRRFLKTVGGGIAAAALSGRAAFGFAKRKFTVRVLGTHVTLQEALRKQAEKDLGIRLKFQPGGSAAVLHQASTRPESFDLYEQWSNSLRVLWQAGAIQAIDAQRIRYWDEVNGLTKTGRLTRQARVGLGDAPSKLLYVQKDGTLGSKQSSKISFLPYVHNVDSFGYNTAVVPRGKGYQTESWGWLLDDRWKGRVALVNAPTIGLFDAALAVVAKGLMKFRDLGNMTRAEIDRLFKILIAYRKRGHFRGVWSSVPQSVELMRKGEAVIQSMFSPGVSAARGSGIHCVYAAPKEGYRAWHGVMCLSAKTTGATQDAAYEYMNWWLSGWPGAFIARQGYYISNPARSKSHLAAEEWDYWYQGKAARSDLRGTDGSVCVKKGEVRNGGSYESRFSNVAVWNTVMDQYDYTLSRWREFLLAG